MARNKEPETLPAARLDNALGKVQDALSRLQLAAEELAIVESTLLGSDDSRRLVVESSAIKPADTAADIMAHQMRAGEIAEAAGNLAKTARTVKSLAEFLARGLGSVYHDQLVAGESAEASKQGTMFHEIEIKAKVVKGPLFSDGSKDDR